jgi:hypothetical protein
MPAPSWLSRDWLRGWTERAESMITLLPGVAAHPLVSRIYPPERIEALLEVWEQRQAWYAALDALPQTICHQDVFPRNAFVRHADQLGQADQTIAIDWAECGKGPVGAELAALIGGSLDFFELERDAADRVEGQCLTSYMQGMADAGWEGAVEDVQLGYLASFVLRFPIGTVGPILTVLLDETLHGLIEQIFGQPMDVFVKNASELAEFDRERISQARRLLADR